jgi:hypothetical protein
MNNPETHDNTGNKTQKEDKQKKNTTQNTREMNNTDPTKISGVNMVDLTKIPGVNMVIAKGKQFLFLIRLSSSYSYSLVW